ncbi:hypothetical protein DPMN_082733 [Dreissena polymorpha]|uniref:Uncharacterized protein n=1 Tax=Dreissena polymorpha TaxID=45954 RepID=A0A9D3YAK7_DREPO|nr:hypothetical protein DPMN_082733 [Dreissena polymorpha]
MEVSTEKSKIRMNSTNNISAEIIINGESLEEVNSFKYIKANLPNDGTSTAVVRQTKKAGLVCTSPSMTVQESAS